MRRRPRRHAVNSALDQAAGQAATCLPQGMGNVSVSGAFEGASGQFIVSNVQSDAPIAPSIRACVTEAFERARVEPFRDEHYQASRTFGASENPPNAVSSTASPESDAGVSNTVSSTASPESDAGVSTTVSSTASPESDAGVSNTTSASTSQNANSGSHDEVTALTEALRTRIDAIRQCYQAQVDRDHDLRVNVRVRFRVEASGVVSNASSTATVGGGSAELADEVVRCIESVVRTTRFPARPSGGPIEITQPFVLAAETSTTSSAARPPTVPTSGSIDPGVVSAVVHTRVPAVRECYNRALSADPTLTGTVQVRFTVGIDGRISSISSQGRARSGNPSLFYQVSRCIENALQTATFPPPSGGPAAFILPFEFGANR